MPKSELAVVLGAGFSSSTGLPLMGNLFEVSSARKLPVSRPKNSAARFLRVAEQWSAWKVRNPDSDAEDWLSHLYEDKDRIWQDAMAFLAARIANFPSLRKDLQGTAWYRKGLTRASHHPVLERFWDQILDNFSVSAIATTNYDLMIEKSLRDSPANILAVPRCHYGAFPHPQYVERMRNVVAKGPSRYEPMRLTGEIPLFKLHGSINWERTAAGLKMYEDLRLAFRKEPSALIVPPIPQKALPKELTQMWIECEKQLSGSHKWLVCGFSLRRKDQALFQMLRSAARTVDLVLLSDPMALELEERWREIVPSTCRIEPLPGLPGLLETDWSELARE